VPKERDPRPSPLTGAPAGAPSRLGAHRFPELRHLIDLARNAWSNGKRPWLGISMGTIAVVVSILLRDPTIGRPLWHSGAVYASLPLPTELARLPMSLFLPTPYLPLWGAVAQLVVVLGLGELVLGRLMTAAIATVGHVVATLAARVVIDLVHASWFGLSPSLVHVLDTGPSAAVTAVGAYLLLSTGMNRCTALLCLGLLIGALIVTGIDGVEHLVALACGLCPGFVSRYASTRRADGETVRLQHSLARQRR
jgi:hypothetical protein